MKRIGAAILIASVLPFASTPGAADPVQDFYRDKTLNFIVSTGVGGGYDIYARALARHIGKHIPGRPNVVVQNMEGGGGIRAMNYLYNVAPHDGTTVGMVHSSVPMAPLQGVAAAKFDATRYNWIGSMNKEGTACISWHTAPVKTFGDLLQKELVVGSPGTGSYMSVYPLMLNQLFGTKIKVVAGYQGGPQVLLAIERGELQGVCGFNMTTFYVNRPAWIAEKKINFLLQTALEPGEEPELRNVPMILDMAKTDEQRAVLEIMFANHQMDRPVLAPPSVPSERVAALRRALKATLDDPEFKKEAEKLSIRYVSGEDVEALLKRLYNAPASVLKAVAEIMRAQ